MNPLTRKLYIYIYIYIIFFKKIILQYKFAPPHHQPDPFNFFKPNLNSKKKKKKVQQKIFVFNLRNKILVFNLRNKKSISQNLKNHKKKKRSNKT